MSRKIPKTLTLPFGYRISIREVAKAELDDCYADWDSSDRVIRIRKSLSTAQKQYLFWHELQHAVLDAAHAALDLGRAQPTQAGEE
jgi:Zn-dependent peptidase ImmA (M78 family)